MKTLISIKLRSYLHIIKLSCIFDITSLIFAIINLAKISRRKLLLVEKRRALSIKNPTIGRILVRSRFDGHKICLARTLFALFDANQITRVDVRLETHGHS